eukprot:6820343-Prymnesium_polylepis.1
MRPSAMLPSMCAKTGVPTLTAMRREKRRPRRDDAVALVSIVVDERGSPEASMFTVSRNVFR